MLDKYAQPYSSPKCYFINQGKTVKRSNKGTPRHISLEYEDYERALFENDIKKATFSRITMEPRLGTVTTKRITKKTMNSVYMKLHVEDDLITVRPHMKNGAFL